MASCGKKISISAFLLASVLEGATTLSNTSCVGVCGNYVHGKSCQCDMNCKSNEDCCNDFTRVCQGSDAWMENDVHHMVATNTTKQPLWNSDNSIYDCSNYEGQCKDEIVSSASCAGSCGNYVPGKSCQCDNNCKNTDDCCHDYTELCQSPEATPKIENEVHEVYVKRKAPLPNQRIRSSTIEVEGSKTFHGTCVGNCFQFNPNDTCQCDALCVENGDCCQDFKNSCTQTS